MEIPLSLSTLAEEKGSQSLAYRDHRNFLGDNELRASIGDTIGTLLANPTRSASAAHSERNDGMSHSRSPLTAPAELPAPPKTAILPPSESAHLLTLLDPQSFIQAKWVYRARHPYRGVVEDQSSRLGLLRLGPEVRQPIDLWLASMAEQLF